MPRTTARRALTQVRRSKRRPIPRVLRDGIRAAPPDAHYAHRMCVRPLYGSCCQSTAAAATKSRNLHPDCNTESAMVGWAAITFRLLVTRSWRKDMCEGAVGV